MLVITNLLNVVGPLSTRLKTKDQVDYTISYYKKLPIIEMMKQVRGHKSPYI